MIKPAHSVKEARRSAFAATATVAVVLAGVAFAAVTTVPPAHSEHENRVSPGASAIAALPVDRLAAAGIRLSQPSGLEVAQAVISENAAAARADHGVPSVVLGTALQHVTDKQLTPPLDGPAWVVSLDPSVAKGGGPPGSNPAPAAFDVVIVSATDGSMLEEVSGSSG